MDIPKYTEEAYWNDVIQQYIDGEPTIRMRHDIEYHIWEYFKDCLRQKNRFFFNHPLIPLLKSALEEHVCELKAGTEVFRARNDDKRELWKEWDTYASAQHTPKVIAGLKNRGVAEDAIEKATQHYEKLIATEKYQEAKARIEAGFQGYDAKGSTAPPSSKAAEGRCNPKGVPYLYVALEKHTAIAEIRPFFKDTISLALLKPVRDLKLVDFFYEPTDTVKDTEILFNNIQRDFSRIHKSNDGEYLITQFIAALIEYLGYDGLRFRSSLVKEGTNYVIFDKSTCVVESSDLCFLSEVTYTFGKANYDGSGEKMLAEAMFTYNLLAYLETLFAGGKGFKAEPDTLNRNYIGHGMNHRAVRKRDCIQLFLALNNLMHFFDLNLNHN